MVNKTSSDIRSSNFQEISYQLKKMRLLKGLTQKDIACRLQKSTNYISKIETGKTKLNLNTLLTYADACKFSIDSLLGLNTYDPKIENPDSLDLMLYAKIKELPVEEKKKILQFIDFIK